MCYRPYDYILREQGGADSPAAVAATATLVRKAILMGPPWWKRHPLTDRIEFANLVQGFETKFERSWSLFREELKKTATDQDHRPALQDKQKARRPALEDDRQAKKSKATGKENYDDNDDDGNHQHKKGGKSQAKAKSKTSPAKLGATKETNVLDTINKSILLFDMLYRNT